MRVEVNAPVLVCANTQPHTMFTIQSPHEAVDFEKSTQMICLFHAKRHDAEEISAHIYYLYLF